ncbi:MULTISPECIES: hypothetical protein [Stomatobaculum]|jgi:hypothetical protein|uniref:hypothetical protein n=1 Tax=Stomatobaculum TaxID=1213720 RepID=UPI00272CC52F|nr:MULTISPECIES: hypothetical protein [Stomatobaculum]WLD86187.1 hypothetical protein QU660_06710 [Stomatobaculum sp. F0698]
MDVYLNLQRLREASAQNLALRRRLAAAARDIQALERDMDFTVWSGKGRDSFIRLFRLWEHALDVAQATAAEKQRLLEEAALSEGALRKQETEALCERFIAAES